VGGAIPFQGVARVLAVVDEFGEGEEGCVVGGVGAGDVFGEVGYAVAVEVVLGTGLVGGLVGGVVEVFYHLGVGDVVTIIVYHDDGNLEIDLLDAAAVGGGEVEAGQCGGDNCGGYFVYRYLGMRVSG